MSRQRLSREDVLNLLERIAEGDEAALQALLAFVEGEGAATRVLLLEALAEEDEETMLEAVLLTLSGEGLPQHAPLADDFTPSPHIESLRDPDFATRLQAVRRLIADPDPRAVPALVALLAEESIVAGEAAEALIRLGTHVVPAMIDALQSANAQVRRLAARVLSQTADERAIPALLDALVDGHSGVRWLAAEALVHIGVAVVEPLLVSLATTPPHAWRTERAYHVLHKLQGGNEAQTAWLRQSAAILKRTRRADLALTARRLLNEWRQLQ
nr:HEAT repeat domain-containing protein [Ardenticatena sp.]